MLRRVAVVVPARNEARWIGEVVRTMPRWVDHIIVVDDSSSDDTASIARSSGDVIVVRHDRPQGVGGAIVSGYRRALSEGAEVVAVMAGDAQMDPRDLDRVVSPVVRGEADYVKGNRLRHPDARAMPLIRAAGTFVFGALTSWATGVRVSDSQCGYTAISRRALETIDLHGLWRSYGYPNDLISAVARAGLRVGEVVVKPVYRGAASGLRPYHAAVILALLGRATFRRLSDRGTAPSPPDEPRSPTRHERSSAPDPSRHPDAPDASPAASA